MTYEVGALGSLLGGVGDTTSDLFTLSKKQKRIEPAEEADNQEKAKKKTLKVRKAEGKVKVKREIKEEEEEEDKEESEQR